MIILATYAKTHRLRAYTYTDKKNTQLTWTYTSERSAQIATVHVIYRTFITALNRSNDGTVNSKPNQISRWSNVRVFLCKCIVFCSLEALQWADPRPKESNQTFTK